ncbi:hypothetical protein RRG08_031099 [Elysia crispata]|uniref:Uncharacterized protein n=1 Tax=Elysia crispata TaxID=231223 RepID=A0AAE0ZFD1_9GAST|nr:hypothetical protein RRG08_031099 [Elysia crispata]
MEVSRGPRQKISLPEPLHLWPGQINGVCLVLARRSSLLESRDILRSRGLISRGSAWAVFDHRQKYENPIWQSSQRSTEVDKIKWGQRLSYYTWKEMHSNGVIQASYFDWYNPEWS